MIRKNPCHDPSAGCFVYERPLSQAIDEYKEQQAQERHQKALEEAFKEGERVGYLRGRADARKALNPSSEENR